MHRPSLLGSLACVRNSACVSRASPYLFSMAVAYLLTTRTCAASSRCATPLACGSNDVDALRAGWRSIGQRRDVRTASASGSQFSNNSAWVFAAPGHARQASEPPTLLDVRYDLGRSSWRCVLGPRTRPPHSNDHHPRRDALEACSHVCNREERCQCYLNYGLDAERVRSLPRLQLGSRGMHGRRTYIHSMDSIGASSSPDELSGSLYGRVSVLRTMVAPAPNLGGYILPSRVTGCLGPLFAGGAVL